MALQYLLAFVLSSGISVRGTPSVATVSADAAKAASTEEIPAVEALELTEDAEKYHENMNCEVFEVAESSPVAEDECTICFDSLEMTDEAGNLKEVIKLDCTHEYHRDCLEEWLLAGQGCPMCRVALSGGTNPNEAGAAISAQPTGRGRCRWLVVTLEVAASIFTATAALFVAAQCPPATCLCPFYAGVGAGGCVSGGFAVVKLNSLVDRALD